MHVEASVWECIRLLESGDLQDIGHAARSIQKLIVNVATAAGTNSRERTPSSKQMDEFISTQNSFASNLAGRVAPRLERLLNDSRDTTAILVVLLKALQGLCLVHRPSRLVFNSNHFMGVLIDCLDHKSCAVQVAAINTLVAVMVRQVENIRRFENLKGLKRVTDLFKQLSTSKQVKLTILEFLFFYLVPETRYKDVERAVVRKTTKDKQRMLGRYLSNVDGLVRELETNQPFGTLELEW